ncbi:MAG: glycoside hydrolase family 3 C-terminal domain-containing protein, partial [Prevotellaceae bacterium]|jgi:beta-glucosidase|nr:glycoside hydrolase family 3 C-terminal domain-containing protein [Prevotellaceae bacterium]
MRTITLFILSAGMIISCGRNQKVVETTPWQNDLRLSQKVDSVLRLMTLEEKIGQMNLLTSDWTVTGPSLRSDYIDLIKTGKVGNIFNAHTAAFTRSLQKIAMEETRMKIPLLFGFDVIHGYKTIFPISLGEAASWDLDAIETSARVAASEAAAAGLHWTFAPMVDISRDPRWGRISEGAGEDTHLGSMIARARVKGFQGNHLADLNTIMACAKHYAAYGAAQAGRDYHTVDMSQRVLRDVYLPPFKAALDEGVATFMTSFNDYDGTPATANSFLLDQILRKEWGFKGFVVSDYTSVNEMIAHGTAADLKDAAKQAAGVGLDMDMQGMAFSDYLEQLVGEGKISENIIDDAVRRILSMKFRLGLFDDPYCYCDEERESTVVFSKENLEKAKEVACKSFVLLKNANQTLPLSTNKRIAIIGDLANNREDMLGSWFGAGEAASVTTILEGMKSQFPRVTYVKGCDPVSNDRSGFTNAVLAARNADVIVFVMGEKGNMSGEAASRASIDIPGIQTQLLVELKKTGKPIVVLIATGRPLTLEKEAELADALLVIWFPGTQAGAAVAEALSGAFNPSGKLPVSFPVSVGQIPLYYNVKNTGRPLHGNEKYTSRYLDVPNQPLFVFGYGLSYTTFEYSDLQISPKEMSAKSPIQISVTVTNTGNFDGSEVVQLYVRDLVGSVTRPIKELKGFQKVSIPKGGAQRVSFSLVAEDLAFTRSNNEWGFEYGEFEASVGSNSKDVITERFLLK